MLINIKEFGAVGDGVTDDTAALKKALAAEHPVYFPAGIYLVREQLFADKISLYWYGAGISTVIRLMPSDKAGTAHSFHGHDVLNMRLLHLEHCNEIELEDLTLDANKDAFINDICGVGSGAHDHTTALNIHGANTVTMRGVTCRNGLIEGAYIYRAKQIRIEKCIFEDNGLCRQDAAGLQIEGELTERPDIQIRNCAFNSNGFNGLELTGINGAVVHDVRCCGNGFDGIAFWKGSSHCRVYGAVAERNRRAGVTFRRNYSAGQLDVPEDDPGANAFCTDNIIEDLVTVGNAYGIHWGCAEQITVRGWHGADEYSHALCYLSPDKDITAALTDVHLAPTIGDVYDPLLVPEDGEVYEQYGEKPHGDPARCKIMCDGTPIL